MGFLREVRGSAGISFVLGAGAMLTATALTFDLMRFVQIQGRAERAAVTVADYASRDPEVDCSDVRRLMGFLRKETLGQDSAGLLAVTAAVGDTGEPNGFAEQWTWDPPANLGSAQAIARLERCGDELTTQRTEVLRALGLAADEAVVMVQLCVTPDPDHFVSPAWILETVGMRIYRHHVLPAREGSPTEVCT